MTPLKTAILERKLEFMRNALLEIERIVAKGEKAYLKDQISQAVLERQVERLVEAAVDAGTHILREEFGKSANSYRETFLELGRKGVIPMKLASEIAPSAGLRNVIAHLYDDLDPKRVFAGALKATKQFPKFMRAIRKFKNAGRQKPARLR